MCFEEKTQRLKNINKLYRNSIDIFFLLNNNIKMY